MKYILILLALLSAVPVIADDCLDAGVRFRSFGDTGGGEVYLGVPDLGTGGNRVEANFNWDSPGSFPFTFTYDRVGDISVTVNGETLNYTNVPFTDIDTLLVTTASRDDDSSVVLENLEVNGVPIPNTDVTDGLISEAFSIADADSGVVSGTLVLNGPFSASQELSRVEIRVGNDDCDLLPPPPNPPQAVSVNSLNIWSIILLITLMGGIALWKIRW